MLTGFHLGNSLAQYSTMSVTSLTEGSGGKMQSFWAKNSFSMSFWVVPASLSLGTLCLSPRATYMARRTDAGPLMVMDVETLSRGMPPKRVSMSLRDETATPHTPTSPRHTGWSES